MIKEFAAGTTILVDKPLEWTSFDVVNKLRWHLRKRLGVKKLKVGHAGTLDPLATGLLVICIGKHTKLIEGLMGGEKTYTGTFLVGKTTPSYDLESEYDQEFDTNHITPELIEEIRLSFIGEQDQIPPIFSAKKINGKRAYESARAGEEVVMKPNKIEISKFTVDDSDFPRVKFELSCSKGTYIRSVASDFGKKLNSGATLIELRRTASGSASIENSKSVEDWIEFIEASPL